MRVTPERHGYPDIPARCYIIQINGQWYAYAVYNHRLYGVGYRKHDSTDDCTLRGVLKIADPSPNRSAAWSKAKASPYKYRGEYPWRVK